MQHIYAISPFKVIQGDRFLYQSKPRSWLYVIIQHFSLSLTAETLRANTSKSAFLKGVGHFEEKNILGWRITFTANIYTLLDRGMFLSITICRCEFLPERDYVTFGYLVSLFCLSSSIVWGSAHLSDRPLVRQPLVRQPIAKQKWR